MAPIALSFGKGQPEMPRVVRYESRWVLDEILRKLGVAKHKKKKEAWDNAKDKSQRHKFEYAEAASMAYNNKAIETWKFVWGRWVGDNERIVDEFEVKDWKIQHKVLERLVLSFGEQVTVNDIIEDVYEKDNFGYGLRRVMQDILSDIDTKGLAYRLVRMKDKVTKEVSYGLYDDDVTQDDLVEDNQDKDVDKE